MAKLATIIITNQERKRLGGLLPEPVMDRIRECGKGFHFNWASFRSKP
jgi:DNA replication protein DnaC